MIISLAILSVLVVSMFFYGVIRPRTLVLFARRFMASGGIWVASGVRFLLAVLLWVAAPSCQTPMVFRGLAAMALVATLAIPLAGNTRMVKWLDRYEAWPRSVVRVQGMFGIALGVFVLWSIWPALHE